MKKLIGPKKFHLRKTAVFISGTGSNLKNLIKFSFTKNSPIQITQVISSNSKAKGLDFARKYKINYQIYKFEKKIKDENKILINLKKDQINLICLAGFMKILSKNFIMKFDGKILNIHPSLLPKYKGLNTHTRAINNNEKFSGCTVHYVNSKLDSGKIILQKKVKINKKDTPQTLAKRILKEEHILYPKALIKIFSNP
tara:strand:- start:212 stop:805 length:594 start_codon:yes stop_codon:yes gene_type:complete